VVKVSEVFAEKEEGATAEAEAALAGAEEETEEAE